MAVTLTSRGDSTLPLDFRGISPAGLRGKSASEIESLPILLGTLQAPLAEHFSVATGGAGDLLVLAGDCRAVHGIGSGLESGSIRVEGEAGRHCGAEMRGGSLEILGSAGDWLGAEMRGGEIRVHGNAGNGVGAAYRGSVRGMRGGEIFIHGSAGD